jgi:hypothetical protein
VNDEAEREASIARETGAFGGEIYFRAQVFHRICTPRRHLFHSPLPLLDHHLFAFDRFKCA